jgi:amidase
MDTLAFLDATAQADLVRRKEVTPIELVDASISRIEKLNPELNAIIFPLYEQARQAAAEVSLDSPFCGVPFLLKDLVAELEGTPLSDGSAFLAKHNIATQDSELVRRFKKAGFIILAKTNSSEFGLLPTTEPEHFGPTRNPWDTSRGTGGSSGGSSAAVASGIVSAAHANDGGGSIRIPASCCGLVGLKPTRGRNSLAPNYGDIAGGIIHEHVVTRTLRDTAAILDATAGPMPGDPYIPPAPERPYLEEVGRDPGRLRIGFGTMPLTGAPAHADCVAGAQSVAKLCDELGHDVSENSPTVNGGMLFKSFGALMTGYLRWVIDDSARRMGRTPTEEDFESVTWKMYQNGKKQSGGDYLMALQDLQRVSRDFGGFFDDYDVWLTPTLAQPPVPIGYFDYAPEIRDQHIAHLGDFTGFTLISNATGNPAISVPLHWTDDGLPVGIQLTGRYGDEGLLIRLASQLEQARPWSDRRPPISA